MGKTMPTQRLLSPKTCWTSLRCALSLARRADRGCWDPHGGGNQAQRCQRGLFAMSPLPALLPHQAAAQASTRMAPTPAEEAPRIFRWTESWRKRETGEAWSHRRSGEPAVTPRRRSSPVHVSLCGLFPPASPQPLRAGDVLTWQRARGGHGRPGPKKPWVGPGPEKSQCHAAESTEQPQSHPCPMCPWSLQECGDKAQPFFLPCQQHLPVARLEGLPPASSQRG